MLVLEKIDEDAFAYVLSLGLKHADNAMQLPDPFARGLANLGHITPRIAYQHRAIPLPARLKPQIVVDAAIGQNGLFGERCVMQVSARQWLYAIGR